MLQIRVGLLTWQINAKREAMLDNMEVGRKMFVVFPITAFSSHIFSAYGSDINNNFL